MQMGRRFDPLYGAWNPGIGPFMLSIPRCLQQSCGELMIVAHLSVYFRADPLYKTSDGRAAGFLELENFSDNKQHRLPSYKNMFSALPERYPSYSLR